MLIAAAALSLVLATELPPPPPTHATPEQAGNYDARVIEGFVVHVNKRFIVDDPAKLERVLVQLRADLDEVAHFTPAPALAALRTVAIWIEENGTHETARGGHGLCSHASTAWLNEHGLLADKVGHVEIINPDDFLNWRRDQPYMLFHEMAHALQWRVAKLDGDIQAAYEHAMKSKLYDAVARNSQPEGKTVRAYAAENSQEYFAELSEAYFALNDFYPYSRAQLRVHDPDGFRLLDRIWNMSAAEIAAHWAPREGAMRAP